MKYLWPFAPTRATVDDIDHLGKPASQDDHVWAATNPQGLLKLRRTAQTDELKRDAEEALRVGECPSKSVASSNNSSFGRGELSLPVSPDNPLSSSRTSGDCRRSVPAA